MIVHTRHTKWNQIVYELKRNDWREWFYFEIEPVHFSEEQVRKYFRFYIPVHIAQNFSMFSIRYWNIFVVPFVWLYFKTIQSWLIPAFWLKKRGYLHLQEGEYRSRFWLKYLRFDIKRLRFIKREL